MNMIIYWAIQDELADTKAIGQFDEHDKHAVDRFDIRSREAWRNGYIVTTAADSNDLPKLSGF